MDCFHCEGKYTTQTITYVAKTPKGDVEVPDLEIQTCDLCNDEIVPAVSSVKIDRAIIKAQYPKRSDCKPGRWVKLNNGWFVGPIVETEFDNVSVEFATGTWSLETVDSPDFDVEDSRLIVYVLAHGSVAKLAVEVKV
tara:strand:+ start:892 stop:1305 length:414 start_codon:yes stop_codon:yes gene_type:complete